VTDSLADYLLLGSPGCELGSATLADFTLGPALPFSTPIAPSDVTVTPSLIPGGLALDFSLALSAIDTALLDIMIRYTVSGLTANRKTLSLLGGDATGNGVVTGVDDTCVGGLFGGVDPSAPCAGTALTSIVLENAFGPISPDSKTFAGSSFFDVFTEITLDGGGAGTASLDGSVRTELRDVPEPATVLLVASGLSIALVRRRTHRF
jgi:hypothetical protein